MNIKLELFEDCSMFDPMTELTSENKGLCWQLYIDNEPVGELINYDQGFMDTLNTLFSIEEKFKLTKINKL